MLKALILFIVTFNVYALPVQLGCVSRQELYDLVEANSIEDPWEEEEEYDPYEGNTYDEDGLYIIPESEMAEHHTMDNLYLDSSFRQFNVAEGELWNYLMKFTD